MKRLMLVMIGTISLGYGIYFAYWPWIKPDEYLKRKSSKGNSFARKYPYLPQVWAYRFFSKYPKIDIFWTRFGSLLFILMASLLLISAILDLYVD